MKASRVAPYENFKFKVKWDGHYVAGVSKIGGLTRAAQVASHRQGGDLHGMRKLPGQSEYNPITLERGITWDLGFEQWANKVWDYTNSGTLGQEASLADFRKDIVIEMYNMDGQRVMAYNIYRCWPSQYTSLPELDAMANAVAIQSLTLQNEGWERDTSVVAPAEPQVEPQFELPPT